MSALVAGRTPKPWRLHEQHGMVEGDDSSFGISASAPYHWVVPPMNLNPADMAYIVRACNSHDALVAALAEAERLIPELVRQIPGGARMVVAQAHDRMRAALAAAQGSQGDAS